MAASFTLPTVLANLTAGNQPLSLIDGDLNALANPLLALITYANGYTDTGAANAYVITVSSPQTVAYAAFLTVTIIPANTSTGASTLAINALGAKSIFAYGANLISGELAAGVPAVLVYDGTQWNLINPLPSFVNYTSTLTGANTSPAVTARAIRGLLNRVSLTIPTDVSATSNATTKTWTGMPTSIRPTDPVSGFYQAVDNSGPGAPGFYIIGTNGVISLFPTAAQGNWTNSGTCQIGNIQATWNI